MVTLVLQCLVGVLALVFGVLAVRVARSQNDGSPWQRLNWTTVGAAFAMGGISNSLYNVAAVWAFMSGPSSIAWASYLRWSPAGNYAGALTKIAMAVVLLAISLRASGWRQRHIAGTLLAAYGAGSLLGWMEGSHEESVHYTNLAAFDMIEAVVLLGALFVGLVRNSIDRLLWICVGLYAFRQVLNVLFLSAMSWIRVPGAWAPQPVHLQIFAMVGYLLMAVIAAHRLRLARRGVHVPGLLEMPARTTPSMIG